MTKDLSRVNFLNVSCVIILTELPLSIRNSTGRALFNVNVVFADWLLILKQYSSWEELSFYNKLRGNFWGFDLQTTAKCPFLHFRHVFPFAILHLFVKMGWIPTAKTALSARKIVFILCYFQPCDTSLHFVPMHNNRLLFGKFHSLGLFNNFF